MNHTFVWPEPQPINYGSSSANPAVSSASPPDRRPFVPKAVPIKLDFEAYQREKTAAPEVGGQEAAAEANLQAFQEQLRDMHAPFNNGFDLPEMQQMVAGTPQARPNNVQLLRMQSAEAKFAQVADDEHAASHWAAASGLPMNSVALSAAGASDTLGSGEMVLEDENRYFGFIRDYNESGGYGFIECPLARARFGMDVWIHRRQMFGYKIGDEVTFLVARNQSGQPQARHVIKSSDVQRLKAKKQAMEKRTEVQLRQKKTTTGPEPKVAVPRVMDEDEAKRFQMLLKRKRA